MTWESIIQIIQIIQIIKAIQIIQIIHIIQIIQYHTDHTDHLAEVRKVRRHASVPFSTNKTVVFALQDGLPLLVRYIHVVCPEAAT